MSLEARTRPSLATGVVFWDARWRSGWALAAAVVLLLGPFPWAAGLLWAGAAGVGEYESGSALLLLASEWRLEWLPPGWPRDRRSALIRSTRLSGGVLAPEEWRLRVPGLSGRNLRGSGVRGVRIRDMLLFDADRLTCAWTSASVRAASSKCRTLSDTLLCWYAGDGARLSGPGVRGFLGSNISDGSDGGDLDPLGTEYWLRRGISSPSGDFLSRRSSDVLCVSFESPEAQDSRAPSSSVESPSRKWTPLSR
jgi:hypothetical protein